MANYRELIERAEESPDFWRNVTAVEFTREVHQRMTELGVNRSELARRLGHSKAYVTKLLSGNANFTLLTMIKVAMALHSIVHTHIADKNVISLWHDMALDHGSTIISRADTDVTEQLDTGVKNRVLDLVSHG